WDRDTSSGSAPAPPAPWRFARVMAESHRRHCVGPVRTSAPPAPLTLQPRKSMTDSLARREHPAIKVRIWESAAGETSPGDDLAGGRETGGLTRGTGGTVTAVTAAYPMPR